MSEPLAYAHILKRRPAQARSARRIEALLDSAADLLRSREPESISVRDLAAGAGVPTGTLYQFFKDKDAVLQALAVRFLAAMPGVLEAVRISGRDDWSNTVGRVVDGYAAMVREHPAIRRLWLSGALDAGTRRLEARPTRPSPRTSARCCKGRPGPGAGRPSSGGPSSR